MIRVIENKWQGYGDRHYIEAAGLSTDAKPTAGLVTGSLFLEVDTGKVYAFDETTNTWNEMGA